MRYTAGGYLVPTKTGSRPGNSSATGLSFKQGLKRASIHHSRLLRRNGRCSRVQSAPDTFLDDELQKNDEHSGVRRGDDIDRALMRLHKYARDPLSAVVDFKNFVVASVFLMRHVHTPRMWKSIIRASVVMVVVVAFMAMIWGLDMLLKHASGIL